MLDFVCCCGVEYFLCVFVFVNDYLMMVEMVVEFDDVFVLCGVYLLYQDEVCSYEVLFVVVSDDKVVVIGEIGFDYYYSVDI